MLSLARSHSGVVPGSNARPVPESPSVRRRLRTGCDAVLGSRGGLACRGRLVLAALDPSNLALRTRRLKTLSDALTIVLGLDISACFLPAVNGGISTQSVR